MRACFWCRNGRAGIDPVIPFDERTAGLLRGVGILRGRTPWVVVFIAKTAKAVTDLMDGDVRRIGVGGRHRDAAARASILGIVHNDEHDVMLRHVRVEQ